MKPEKIKQALNDTIQAITDHKWLYSVRPGKDHTRNRKFPFSKTISSILAFRGGTLDHEIMDFFGLDPSIGTSSAFIQQRAKICPEAFEALFHYFAKKTDEDQLYCGLRMLAVDGSSLQLLPIPMTRTPIFPAQTVKELIICCISMRCTICFVILIRMPSFKSGE